MNAPKLRFKEFKDEWQKYKVGEILKISNGINKEKEFFGSGTPIINYMDVNKNELITHSIVRGLVIANSKELKTYNVKKGDILFTRTSETSDEIGLSSSVIENIDKCIFSGFILKGTQTGNYIHPYFGGYYFRNPKMRKEIIKHSSITTRALTSGSLLTQMLISIPSLNEQEKIGKILLLLDKKIELQSKKIEDLKLFKSSQISSVIDSLKCDEIELREIGNFISGNAIGKEKIKESGVPIILYGDLYTKYWEVIDKVEQYTEDNEKYIKSKKNDLLFPTSTTVDSISLISPSSINIDDVIYGGDLIVFRADYTRINSDFLSYQINHYKRKEFSKKAQGSTIIHIHAEDLLSSKVKLPNIEIQNLISKTFNILNKKIIKEEEKLNKLNNLKKGLMQSMFV